MYDPKKSNAKTSLVTLPNSTLYICTLVTLMLDMTPYDSYRSFHHLLTPALYQRSRRACSLAPLM